MKTGDLGEAVFELMEQLRQATSFGLPPFPASDQLKDFRCLFEHLTRCFEFPLPNTSLAPSAESDRALLTLQGWELPV